MIRSIRAPRTPAPRATALLRFLGDMKREYKRFLTGIVVDDLKNVPIDRLEFSDGLPCATPAIYFVKRPTGPVLYIGRASNLRARWSARRQIFDNAQVNWELTHQQFKVALELGDVSLYWLAVPREHLAVVEIAMIEIHKPAWNVARC